MAAQQVFSVPEILESILLNLDVGDIFVAKMVNTNFHSVIKGSIKLQQATFLRYKPPPPSLVGGDATMNPLLNRILAPLGFSGDRDQFARYAPHRLKLFIDRERRASVQFPKASFESDGDPTWRLTKLTDYPVVTTIRVQTWCGVYRIDRFELEGEAATLGQLFEILLELNRRIAAAREAYLVGRPSPKVATVQKVEGEWKIFEEHLADENSARRAIMMQDVLERREREGRDK